MFSDEALGPDLCQQFVGVQLEAFCEDPTLRRRVVLRGGGFKGLGFKGVSVQDFGVEGLRPSSFFSLGWGMLVPVLGVGWFCF